MLNSDYVWGAAHINFFQTAPYNYFIIDDFFMEDDAHKIRSEIIESWNWRYKNWVAKELYCRKPTVACLTKFARALQLSLPVLLGSLELVDYWAIIHNQNSGLHVHADNGTIAVNIWLTEDKYSLNSDQVGLKLFDVKRTEKMKVHEFGTSPTAEDFLRTQTSGGCVEIPYKFNRAVIFDAATFHCSGAPSFQCASAESCKINFTLVYDDKSAFEYRRG